MAIIIYLGNVGSGKTLSAVRNIAKNMTNRTIYSNIKTRKLKNVKMLKGEHIIKKEHIRDIKKRNGDIEPVYELTMNKDYWKNLKVPINIMLDEVHNILNSRKSMSKPNIIMTDWLALIRRILGDNSAGTGDLIMISQLKRRIDPIAREMAQQYRYHICHYQKTCNKCQLTWQENSEQAEQLQTCPRCTNWQIKKHSLQIEVFHFSGETNYETWYNYGRKTYYNHYFINDCEKYFNYYNSLQWSELLSEYY